MKKSIFSIGIRLLLLISFCICIYTLYCSFDTSYSLGYIGRLLMSLFFILPLCIAAFFIGNRIEGEREKRKFYHIMWFILFIYYVLQMIYILFFAGEFARDAYGLFHPDYTEYLRLQWDNYTNLTPLHTIQLMINAYENQLENMAAMNLFGNFIAFMPFAIFLPKLFTAFRKTWKFLLFMAMLIIFVEITQLITLTGSMDIDDFILNFAGTMLCYLFFKIPFLQNLMKQYLYY